ncbi:MAG: V-type ATP synthase subunit E family protein [Candidatus Omnitrophota bacterium]
MAEEIKNLIEKIHSEGIQAAEAKAAEIENKAREEADAIVSRAKEEAEAMLSAAKERISRMEEKSKTLLTQAARDLLLSLRKEINAVLGRLVNADVRSALNPDALQRIILEMVKNYPGGQEQEIVISLKKEDAEQLQKHFLGRLKEETKRNIVIKPSEDILGGFTISFDAGKSQFDFTDKALAEYISLYLKPNLSGILKEATS